MTTTLPADPWKALGVERDADKSDIRAAYKKLVLQCHPDKVQDPTLKARKQNEFQKVQQAYELLNDDAEKAKYEQKLKLADMQRAASKIQQEMKNSPNSSVPRTSARYTATAAFDIRSAEPASKYKTGSSPSNGKVYTHFTTYHTRSHEEMPSSRIYPVYEDGDRQARKSASYEKPSKRDEERRDRDKEERRRRRETREDEEATRPREKERERERERERDREREKDRAEREKEKEREARRAERKRLEKERDKERRRDQEDKYPPRSPYIERQGASEEEPWAEDEKYVSSRSERKRSSSKKHDETREREREKSSSRRAKSPHMPSENIEYNQKLYDATTYITFVGGKAPPVTARAPTPPPLDYEEESIQRSSARAAGRRSSHDAARSKEKLDKLRYEAIDTIKGRPIPKLSKSYSTPVSIPEFPPRVSRSNTAPQSQSYDRHIPTLSRTQTYLAAEVLDGQRPTAEYYDDYGSDDERERHRRRSRRGTRSPAPEPVRYKVDGVKTSKLDAQYAYGESPTSRRRHDLEAHSPSTYAGAPFKVKESRSYGPSEIIYSEYNQPAYYASDGYNPVMA
jgi:curved DNA-binding protein CbpA